MSNWSHVEKQFPELGRHRGLGANRAPTSLSAAHDLRRRLEVRAGREETAYLALSEDVGEDERVAALALYGWFSFAGGEPARGLHIMSIAYTMASKAGLPSASTSAELLGKCRAFVWHHLEALASYRAAAVSAPPSRIPKIRALLSGTYLKVGRTDLVRRHLGARDPEVLSIDGHLSDARAHWERALSECPTVAAATRWSIATRLGQVHTWYGEFDRAIDRFRAGISDTDNGGDVHGQVAHLDLAVALCARGDSAAAQASIHRAQEFVRAAGEFGLLPKILLAQALVRSRRDVNADGAFAAAIDSARRARTPFVVAETLGWWAAVERAGRRVVHADRLMAQAREQLHGIGYGARWNDWIGAIRLE